MHKRTNKIDRCYYDYTMPPAVAFITFGTGFQARSWDTVDKLIYEAVGRYFLYQPKNEEMLREYL